MARPERSIVAMITVLAIVGAFADGRIDFETILPLLVILAVAPAWTRAEAATPR